MDTNFRANELDTLYPGNPFVFAFVEYRPTRTTTITLSVDELVDVASRRERTFFLPDRRTCDPFRISLPHLRIAYATSIVCRVP